MLDRLTSGAAPLADADPSAGATGAIIALEAAPPAAPRVVPGARRRVLVKPLLLAVLIALTTLGLQAVWLEPRRLVAVRENLDVPNWPATLQGTRIALISDLHVGSPYWDLPELERLVERTNRERPELVLLAGDYLNDTNVFGRWVDPEPVARVLGRLQAPLGTIAVLGNHDWVRNGERIRRAFESEGIVVLENAAHPVQRGDARFFVVGVADELMRRPRVAEAIATPPAGAPHLVLVHEPDVFAAVPDSAALTLAGHTHGGQVRLPLVGRPVVPSRFGERFAAGHVVDAGRHLFVTSGVGTSLLPVRFGVPPEVAFLTLE